MHVVITVLGGGWSASQVDLTLLPGLVIGVNDAALHAPGVDVIVSMDRLWTEGRWAWLVERGLPFYARWAAIKKMRRPLPEFVRPFHCNNHTSQFTKRTGWLNGTHSGGCAFNLAYLHRPHVIYLVGFDMRPGPNGEAHWYPDYDWGTSKVKPVWGPEFEVNAEQCRKEGIEVYVVGEWSAVTAFPRVPYDFAKGQS